ncbi:hypothetical protein ASPWEDRAFT_439775 [Aspergillus wentii DTO 134E9]|uniref:UBL3-like ubiquitin domain-containing protein n=1 Tax=Aspergillus wentii DTO 134E9 TaxID=1073089 RepID=A0A1L9RQ80_ASPWE|nr:uncharacterized protein ASPWEDRAFT_439775 [Aspergillus wentii DTO 134E9]KAI9928396.1 hypothetical protein MW887_002436 [Aspergillus wentii]OJJ37116.1 hypothetical protein ASPWEDRAFT_439775 [Aspergillus wentii DTO 134E9]
MSTSDQPGPGLSGIADPSAPASTGSPHEQSQQPQPAPVSSSETAQTHNSPAQTEDTQRGQTTADAKPEDGGESTTPVAPAAPAQAKDTEAAAAPVPSPNNVSQLESEEPKVVAPAAAQSASEEPSDATAKEADEDPGPSLVITLLLITGSRHPFKIDGRYLRKQSVNVENHDPFLMSVYTLKELIWREWRSDWEQRPTSPSSIRLISFGKLLEDKAPLSDSKFSRDAPNVVHMTVKPQELVDEEDAKGAKTQYTREREASERSPSCRCVIL